MGCDSHGEPTSSSSSGSGGDGGQVLVFSVFLLSFVIVVIVGQSLVLFARAREAERQRVEVFSRDTVDAATGFVNTVAADATDLQGTEGALFETDGSLKPEYKDKWFTPDGGPCDTDADGVVDADAGTVGCWRIREGGTDTTHDGLADTDVEVVRVEIEVRAGCTPGVDRLNTTTGTVGGCATGEHLELRYKRRSLFDYLLHYDTNTLPLRWKTAYGITYNDVLFDATGATGDDRDVIDGPIHTNLDHVLVCGKEASGVFTSKPEVGETPSGSTHGKYVDDCPSSHTYPEDLTDTGKITIAHTVVDDTVIEGTPQCHTHTTGSRDPADREANSGNTDWLRDARRPAEADVAGWRYFPSSATISLGDYSSTGSKSHITAVYAKGDLTITAGSIDRPLTVISEQDIILQGTPKKLGDDINTFETTGQTKGRLNVLGLIAGCDIHIDYTLNHTNTLPDPVPYTNTLRPREPDDPPPPYPTNNWTTHEHFHYFVADLVKESYSVSCTNNGGSGSCSDTTGYPDAGGFRRTWWRDSRDDDISHGHYYAIEDANDAYEDAENTLKEAKEQYNKNYRRHHDPTGYCDDIGNNGNGSGRIDTSDELSCHASATSASDPDPSNYVSGYNAISSRYNSAMSSLYGYYEYQSWSEQPWDCSEITSCSFSATQPEARGWISNGCDDCTSRGSTDINGNFHSWWRAGSSSSNFFTNISESEYETRKQAWSDYNSDKYDCDYGRPDCSGLSEPSYPYPVHVPMGVRCTPDDYDDYDTATPGAEFGTVTYGRLPDSTTYDASCREDGIYWTGMGREHHDEYRVWNGWSPTAPVLLPPVDAPRSYPHGVTRDSTETYTRAPKDPNTGDRLDPAVGSPPADTTDDGYCASWGPWVVKPARKVWQPIDFSIADDATSLYGFSITGSSNLGAPYHDSTWTSLSDHMSPEVTQETVDLEGGWDTGAYPGGYENHLRSSTDHHGPDSLTVLISGIYGTGPPRGGISKEFHPDYRPNSNNLKAGLVTKSPDSTLSETIGYASDHWPAYVMVDPTPLHELCDFMGFELTNVALLAPAGGLIADQWFLPRQTGSNPTIEINGSITVKHRGLFARSDTSGDLTTGYRKHFTHPAGIQQGTTTWWPDLKQNHWTPQP